MANTFSTEENARESKRLYALLDGGIRERLMKYPGVRHVSVGLKITGDEMLWERCFHVYVDKKLSPSELEEEDLVPGEIDGIKTDVHEIGEASLAVPVPVCADRTRYRPVKGGITISTGMEWFNEDRSAVNDSLGTLGVIGRIKGRSRCSTMALTNWHVLYYGRAFEDQVIGKGTRVFQPTAITNINNITSFLDPQLAFDPEPDPNTKENDIGKVIDGIYNKTVDCGLLEINRSCCNCCGVPYENTISELETVSPLNFNGVRGMARTHTGDKVFFVGATSGPSKAIVVTDSASIISPLKNILIADPRVSTSVTGDFVTEHEGQIKIRAADDSHRCNAVVPMEPTYTGPPFSRVVDGGDSGALLVNDQNMAVGLIWGTEIDPPTTEPFTLFGYANHYEDVISALQAAGHNFEVNYTQPSTGGSRGASLVGYEEPESEIFLEWKKRIEAHPKTKAIADAVSRNHDEVILLVNHCRPVTVAWHRGKGPAFAAILAGNVREEKFEFPEVVNGVSVEQLLLRMRAVLLVHGSNSLKDDIEKFGGEILAAVKGKNNFEDLMLALTGDLEAENNSWLRQR